MAKPNPLAQGLESLSKPLPVSAQDQQPIAAKRAASSRTSAREGQTLIGGFFAPEVHKQLKVLAAESSQTQQELIAEALNMLFVKYGKPEIATLGRIPKSSRA
jgi:hypothetical protein